VGVVSVGALTDGGPGRYDSAVAELDDGRRVIVRASTDDAAAAALSAQARALRALTPGVRALLPFAAPELLGEADLDSGRAVVLDFIPGYHVDAAHVPAGPGVASVLGEAIAAVHALPTTVVRSEGLTALTPDQSRDEVVRLVDRTEQTRRAPAALVARWRQALAASHLWRFEASVVLGGVDSVDFLFADGPHGLHVAALLEWSGLAVGDPAIDLRWTSSAPAAAADVLEAYAGAVHRAPDAGLRTRARMYAELEFAKWLLHGVEEDDEEIVEDAVALLTALADGVSTDSLVADTESDVEDALAILGRVAPAATAAIDTSMQTDAYDAESLSEYLETDDLSAAVGRIAAPTESAFDEAAITADPPVPPVSATPQEDTQPIDPTELVALAERAMAGLRPTDSAALQVLDDSPVVPVVAPPVADEIDPVADQADAERASRAALHRWARSDSE
jgi:aminoglycoside phosphotransferase (APT) family kinase protein